jgi:protein-tyrosine phosphatase
VIDLHSHVRLGVRLVAGGEVSLEEAARLPADELQRLSLGRAGTLLVELPYQGWPVGLDEQLFRLRAVGFRVLLAHPERNAEAAARPERLRP